MYDEFSGLEFIEERGEFEYELLKTESVVRFIYITLGSIVFLTGVRSYSLLIGIKAEEFCSSKVCI